MFIETLTPAFATKIEPAELNAWLDLYAVAPADFTRQFRLEILLLACCREAGVRSFGIYHNPHCRSTQLAEWFKLDLIRADNFNIQPEL